MDCKYTGSFNRIHYKKRRIIGSEKERTLNAMLTCHVAPSVYRRNEANRLMVEGIFFFLLLIFSLVKQQLD